MTDDFQEIDGVGPSREDKLNNEGYETYDDLAEADYEELAEEINRLPEDSALDIVVQAQNLADLEEAEVSSGDGLTDDEADSASENEEVEEEAEDDAEDVESEDTETDASEDTETETHYSVTLDFDGKHEYDTFYHTLIEERCNLRRTNRSGVDSYEKMLASMREIAVDGEFTVELTEDELNDLHNAVLEQRYDYQGENLIDYMDALRRMENRLNGVREEFLF